MSSGGGQASRDARNAAQSDKSMRLKMEDNLKRDKMRTQNLFIRQMRAGQGGGFFTSPPGDTLG